MLGSEIIQISAGISVVGTVIGAMWYVAVWKTKREVLYESLKAELHNRNGEFENFEKRSTEQFDKLFDLISKENSALHSIRTDVHTLVSDRKHHEGRIQRIENHLNGSLK